MEYHNLLCAIPAAALKDLNIALNHLKLTNAKCYLGRAPRVEEGGIGNGGTSGRELWKWKYFLYWYPRASEKMVQTPHKGLQGFAVCGVSLWFAG